MTASPKKRPDTRGNAVEPVSSANPAKGKALMNNQEDSTVVPEGTEIAFRVDTEWLAGLEPSDAAFVYDVLTVGQQAMADMLNRPRASINGYLSPAGEFLEDLTESLFRMRDAICEDRSLSRYHDRPEALEQRALLLLKNDLNLREPMAMIAASASAFAAELWEANFSANHPKREVA